MELKDMILSTLAELETPDEQAPEKEIVKESNEPTVPKEQIVSETSKNEKQFFEDLRERILVLFEGFQSPNNKNIEAKVELTLNFLEYLLAIIDERLENLDKK